MPDRKPDMCNLYSITTNQAAISALFRVPTVAPDGAGWRDDQHGVFLLSVIASFLREA